MTKALLGVMMQPPFNLEEEFNDWYDTEHLADRVAAPGFESGRRYDSVTGGPRAYLTLYDLAHVHVLDTPEYRLVSGGNFTPWTKRLMRRIPRLRILAEQVHPGDETVATTPFVTLMRFASVQGGLHKEVVAGTTAVGSISQVVQARAFKETIEGRANYYILVGSTARVEDQIDVRAFEGARGSLDFVRTFVPHAVGWTWEKSI
jgi:hypothetical protein